MEFIAAMFVVYFGGLTSATTCCPIVIRLVIIKLKFDLMTLIWCYKAQSFMEMKLTDKSDCSMSY